MAILTMHDCSRECVGIFTGLGQFRLQRVAHGHEFVDLGYDAFLFSKRREREWGIDDLNF